MLAKCSDKAREANFLSLLSYMWTDPVQAASNNLLAWRPGLSELQPGILLRIRAGALKAGPPLQLIRLASQRYVHEGMSLFIASQTMWCCCVAHTCCHWQEGLVDGVDVHIIYLVDAHNVAVAAQQAQHAQQRSRQQAPIYELHQKLGQRLQASTWLAHVPHKAGSPMQLCTGRSACKPAHLSRVQRLVAGAEGQTVPHDTR